MSAKGYRGGYNPFRDSHGRFSAPGAGGGSSSGHEQMNAAIRQASGRGGDDPMAAYLEARGGSAGSGKSAATAAAAAPPPPTPEEHRRMISNAAVETLRQARYSLNLTDDASKGGWGVQANADGSISLVNAVTHGRPEWTERSATSIVRDLRVRGFDAKMRYTSKPWGDAYFDNAIDIPGTRSAPADYEVEQHLFDNTGYRKPRPTGTTGLSDAGVEVEGRAGTYTVRALGISNYRKNGHYGREAVSPEEYGRLADTVRRKFEPLGYQVEEHGPEQGLTLTFPADQS